MLPKAQVVHRAAERVRIRVPEKKGDVKYFEKILRALEKMKSIDVVTVNASTGGVLIIDKNIEIEALAEYAREKKLFGLEPEFYAPAPLAHRVANPIKAASSQVRSFTGGELDLASVAFLTLLGVGVYQLARGRFAFPPFYTAFWYAFGIFTKSILDKSR